MIYLPKICGDRSGLDPYTLGDLSSLAEKIGTGNVGLLGFFLNVPNHFDDSPSLETLATRDFLDSLSLEIEIRLGDMGVGM